MTLPVNPAPAQSDVEVMEFERLSGETAEEDEVVEVVEVVKE
jgi:hypothetical protein